jgi:uncharacterized protein YlaI
MVRLRSHFEADYQRKNDPTIFKSEDNKNKVYCVMCGGIYFVDDYLFNEVVKILKETHENPFFCDSCQSKYEEMAYR